MLTWTSEKRRIEELQPAPYNPRKWSDSAIKNLTTSIEKFDLADPIVINRNNRVIGGHFRLKILKDRGVGEVDVRIPSRELNEAEERELNVRLNKNLGDWDFELLADFDQDLLADIGFSSEELDKIFQIEDKPEDDDVPEVPEEAKTKTGDIYLLGRHRLMCGDSTKVDDVEKLMDGKNADMVFTSPPYNVGIKYSKHNDTQNVDEYFKFIKDVMVNCFIVMNEGRLIAWNVGVSPKSKPYHHAISLEDCGFQLFRHIVWKKTGCQIPLWQNSRNKPNARHYMPNYNHEMIYMMSKGDVQYGTNTQMPEELSMDVWDVSQFSAGGNNHPAAFPVRLAELAIMAMTSKDELCFDPFSGSGSHFIACEKTNRICYGMEIDPKYCDVIVKRWEDYTGQKAVLNGSA